MVVGIRKLYFVFIIINISISVFSQVKDEKVVTPGTVIDSIRKSGVIFRANQKTPEIILSKDQAIKVLQEQLHPMEWNDTTSFLRQAFSRLIYKAVHPPFDSVRNILLKYPYDSLSIPQVSGNMNMSDALKDTTIISVIDSLNEAPSSYSAIPFKYFNCPNRNDSIKAAITALLNYLDRRDSTVINFTGIGNSVIPFMMNSGSGKVIRYWLKNEFSDSVTIWIENTARNTIGLYLEQGVNFRRPLKQSNYGRARIDLKSLDNTKLLDIHNIAIKKQYWKYRTEYSLVLNQASLSNWVKGGESSISTAVDVTEYADYINKTLKLSSNNFARLNFGYLESGQTGIRKNLDLLETNSKLNHKAFGKFDFSAIMLFKTQIARGYNYSDTSLVSKFMNPAILTVGFGLDYKPNKTTSLNFSPLSYKATFVTDTMHIDQTQYGIAKNRKSLNEPGVSFMITNEFKPFNTVSIINRLQLFTNYIHNPQNVDVDWEMIATAKLNWFTEVRFNTHLIFDDDTRTEEIHKNGQPVLKPDGTKVKTARIQFKEMLGFSLSFRF